MDKAKKKRPLVFLDVSIDGDPAERMIFELFTDFAPKTAENFRALCTGEKGLSSKTGKPLHYKGTFFHRIIKGYIAQAGDFLRQDGNFGESIYDGNFPDESPKLKHDAPGLLSMALADRDERGSLFSVTFKADHHLDRKCIVFGELVDGYHVLKKIEDAGDEEGRPSVTVKIKNSGEINDDKKKGNKLKMVKDGTEEDGGVRRKRKHKKSSKKRRKRKRYYTSDSDSSSDTDTESSESDSDSDSYATSLSDTSSSSDYRRKKRKRSKRDKHKRGKRKDRRRVKQRKRQDKKTKRKSKRNNISDSERTSSSGSSSDDSAAVGALEGKLKSSENQSPSVKAHKTSTVIHKKRDATDMSAREEVEFPRENGDHQSNGIELKNEYAQRADSHPDLVDDRRPSNSRSKKLSPRRTTSNKSMSISPRRSDRRSPAVSKKDTKSRSRSVSRSPLQISNKSIRSPVRSGSSVDPIASPPRTKKGIRGRMSPPVGSPSQQSPSKSATESPPRRGVSLSPPRNSSRRSLRSASGSPARLPKRSLSRSLSRSPKRSSRRSASRSSGRAPPRRSPSRSPVRVTNRITRRSYSRSPVGAGRRARSPIPDRGRSSSRSRSVGGSPKRVQRGRGFSERYSYARRYRSRSPDRSPIRSYRYGGRSDRDRYSGYRRSPRRYRSPPRGRTPPRYRGRRSPSRSISRSPIRRRRGQNSRSPSRPRASPRGERRKTPSRSRSRSESQSPVRALGGNSRSSSGSPPPKTGLVSYGDGSPDSSRD